MADVGAYAAAGLEEPRAEVLAGVGEVRLRRAATCRGRRGRRGRARRPLGVDPHDPVVLRVEGVEHRLPGEAQRAALGGLVHEPRADGVERERVGRERHRAGGPAARLGDGEPGRGGEAYVPGRGADGRLGAERRARRRGAVGHAREERAGRVGHPPVAAHGHVDARAGDLDPVHLLGEVHVGDARRGVDVRVRDDRGGHVGRGEAVRAAGAHGDVGERRSDAGVGGGERLGGGRGAEEAGQGGEQSETHRWARARRAGRAGGRRVGVESRGKPYAWARLRPRRVTDGAPSARNARGRGDFPAPARQSSRSAQRVTVRRRAWTNAPARIRTTYTPAESAPASSRASWRPAATAPSTSTATRRPSRSYTSTDTSPPSGTSYRSATASVAGFGAGAPRANAAGSAPGPLPVATPGLTCSTNRVTAASCESGSGGTPGSTVRGAARWRRTCSGRPCGGPSSCRSRGPPA